MLAGYLQCGESTIMKLARILWKNRLTKEGIWYKFVNFIHDEWQTVTNKEDAEYVAKVQREAIVEAGEILGLNCPLAGDSKIGLTWSETH